MKKMILGAGAVLLSSSVFAGVGHANSSNDPSTSTSTVHASSMAWAMNPSLQAALVEAGMNHADPSAAGWMSDKVSPGNKNVQLSAAHMAEKQTWLAGNGMTGTDMAMTAGKNMELTAEHMGEKQMWLAQNGSTGTATAMAGGKNTELTAAHMSEKQSWLAQNNAADTGVEMAGGKEMNGQGGPLELAENGGDGTLPACRPGPGDDRCIQLYERGMSRAYRQWAAGRSNMGMGGPEEPVAGKGDMASTTSDMSMAAKADNPTGPTTEPTGVRVTGKSAMGTAS